MNSELSAASVWDCRAWLLFLVVKWWCWETWHQCWQMFVFVGGMHSSEDQWRKLSCLSWLLAAVLIASSFYMCFPWIFMTASFIFRNLNHWSPLKCEKKKIIKIIGLLAYFCFPSLASMHAWMTPAPTGHISLSSAHCPPSLPIQTAAASLCATHYPAIPVSREEIVNVSGAGDRYMANFSVFPSYMWNHPNMISFKFYYKGKLCSVAWGAGTRTGPVTVIPCSAH